MKNIYEIMKEFGIEIPEDKKDGFDKAWKENYRTKAEFEKAAAKRDEYKQSLEDVQGKLKDFEKVDVEDLQNQVKTLTADLQREGRSCCRRVTQGIGEDSRCIHGGQKIRELLDRRQYQGKTHGRTG